MGVTKQAAQKRFVPKDPGEPSDLDPNQGFNRFTPRARNVVVAGAERGDVPRTTTRSAPNIWCSGLLCEPDGLAARAIVAQGVSLDNVRRARCRAAAAAGRRRSRRSSRSTRIAKKVLELTFREALRLGHNYIGTEHILLSLLELEDGTGVLADLGIDKATTEAIITAQLVEVRRNR